ncbi:BTB/POZ domain-containing protein At2g30600 [Gossypium arboreum]|uniref:BTB/POZ domain-containing protein At2g30600 n=1 Tax=Gossypium arboreum TaxID=29729 RepID=UPI00081908F4|nr:BTB/POZ domain-containing protein At2g30600 [Gossypium arboreum]XP_017606273.1 BTB/POZ domain-containing protein At2g30600 [Gossypium arboreum]XP_052884066.1 BTB/POZ domain-containing protein At2g30600 [Gossypium arboreum]XP_052884067.1 BTB/POZ domain-containing protein At2g30600 [Gossypium arboreum]
METKEKKFLTVAPFECAWIKDLKFREAGRGCVSFDAFAHNDVTVVFRENVGSQHYHYKRDNSPHYTVIIGSHRNSRLKIEVDGKTVVDVVGIGLCCSSAFQSYWISIYDGLISIGKGRYPFQNLVFEWLDTNPNCSVQYVGLSSWDKHVGYRNVNVLPLTQNHLSLWKQVNSEYNGDGDEELEDEQTGYDKWGLENFLESWELSDLLFIVGEEARSVPAHKVILQASGNFGLSSSHEDVIQLQQVAYPTLHALLQYVYAGQTQISEAQLSSLWGLALRFEVMPLVKQCEEAMERFKANKKLSDLGETMELSYASSHIHFGGNFCCGLPINMHRLQQLLLTGEYSDISIYIEGQGLIARAHKVILGLYSVPFTKMFTNGMCESNSPEVCLRDVSPAALKAMLEFMYCGDLRIEDNEDFGTLLLQLLLLSDKFGISLLHQECCKMLLECLSEDSVCPILQAVSSIPSCKLIKETCERKFAMHFDYCTTASLDFISLDETTFRNIIQHPDLTVISEERVLDAILMWYMKSEKLCGWEVVNELITNSTLECVFKDRLKLVNDLLASVRFSLLPYPLLKKLENTSLSTQISAFGDLVKEAINYIECGAATHGNDQNERFQHRRSSYKELQYICDGDSNGVLYFSGTSYGEHPWVNPVLSKRITITASSPASRHTDPKVLVSRTYQGTCFAGPRMENGNICAWWMVDIGKDHQLMCNYYTLRQDGSRAYIRNWKFQGCMDGKTWIDLRVHENDQTMCKPGQFASWPVTGPNALLPFRFFRVLLTGLTTDASNPWNLCICFLELYGYFR